METKNVLVVALAGVFTILTATSLRSAGKEPEPKTTSGETTEAAPTKKVPPTAGAKGAADRKAAPTTKAAAEKGGGDKADVDGTDADKKKACAPSDPLCQAEGDFPGLYEKATAAALAVNEGPMTVVLASLPNPSASGFTADFDRDVEAIERALQSDRFVLQRHWFPWDEAAADGDAKPGWLLFRRHRTRDGAYELLLVLLVTERPASGVVTAELDGALDKLEALAGKAGDPATAYPRVLFLGPSFSGTALSLEQHLRAWCGQHAFCATRELQVISGSATVRRTQEIFERLGKKDQGAVFRKSEFHATVLPDDVLRGGMHRFLTERMGVSAKEIADLTEASTDYGLGDPPAGEPTGPKIPFPRHLGVLADAKAAAAIAADQPKAFDLEATQKIGLQLDNTFAALSRSGIRHVGIMASATRDKIFLSEQLLKFAPNLRVHVYESSIDLADRSKDSRGLEGLMVASSYPLFPTTQQWSSGCAGKLQQFPSMTAEGIYNATLALLAKSDKELDARLSDALLDYRAPFCPDSVALGPSAWVSVSIEHRLWPLVVYPAALAASSSVKECGASADPFVFSPPRGKAVTAPMPQADIGFLTILGLLAVALLAAGNLWGLTDPWRTSAWWQAPFVTYRLNREDAGQTRVATAGLWALAITVLTMGKILRLPGMLTGQNVVAGPWHNGGSVIMWAAFALIVASATLPTHPLKGLWRTAAAWLQGLLCLAMLGAILFLPLDELIKRPDGHAFFFYLRAMDTGIGLTPTIPLFITGMTIYAACLMQLSVQRRAAALTIDAKEWPRPPHPPSDENPPAASEVSFGKCAAAMDGFAEEASRSLLPVCLVGTAIGFAVLFWSTLRLGSFEGRLFDGGCSACFALLFTLTLAAAYRAHVLWFRLRAFTRALALHPACDALARLPPSVAQRFQSPVPGQVGNHHIESALEMTIHKLGAAKAPVIKDLLAELEPSWFPADGKDPKALEDVAKLKEDYLSLKMADILGLMCDATRTMLFVATGAGMAALFGYALYPFQPGAALTGASLVSIGLVATVALRILLGIERDRVLSLLGKTTADKITPSLGLVTRIVGYVIVPLGGLVGSRIQDQGTVIQAFQEVAKMLSR